MKSKIYVLYKLTGGKEEEFLNGTCKLETYDDNKRGEAKIDLMLDVLWFINARIEKIEESKKKGKTVELHNRDDFEEKNSIVNNFVCYLRDNNYSGKVKATTIKSWFVKYTRDVLDIQVTELMSFNEFGRILKLHLPHKRESNGIYYIIRFE